MSALRKLRAKRLQQDAVSVESPSHDEGDAEVAEEKKVPFNPFDVLNGEEDEGGQEGGEGELDTDETNNAANEDANSRPIEGTAGKKRKKKKKKAKAKKAESVS